MVSPSLEDDTTLLNKYAWIMRSDIRSLCAVTTGAMRREMKGWWWLREIGVDRYYTGPQKCALAKRVAEFARDAREEHRTYQIFFESFGRILILFFCY